MPLIWIRFANDPAWTKVTAPVAPLRLRQAETPVARWPEGEELDSPAGLVPCRRHQRLQWFLLTKPAGHVLRNGLDFAAELTELADVDHLQLPGFEAFFVAGGPAARVPFPGGEQTLCERCTDKLEIGQPAVACPQCGRWHHQDDKDPAFACWTYDDQCATGGCTQPTKSDKIWEPKEF